MNNQHIANSVGDFISTEFSNSSFDKISRLLYCGGIKSALSMLIFWTSITLVREIYSRITGEDIIFHNTEEIVFWVVGVATIVIGLVGLKVSENRLRYLSLLLGSFVQIWVAVQFYLHGSEPSSFVPAATALWFFGAAIYFKGVMNGHRTCAS
nr:MAG TPA: hypothetical protein [Caudoviricetes sp.]